MVVVCWLVRWVWCVVGGAGVWFVWWWLPREGVRCGYVVRGVPPGLCVDQVDGLSPFMGQPFIKCLYGLSGHGRLLLDKEWG